MALSRRSFLRRAAAGLGIGAVAATGLAALKPHEAEAKAATVELDPPVGYTEHVGVHGGPAVTNSDYILTPYGWRVEQVDGVPTLYTDAMPRYIMTTSGVSAWMLPPVDPGIPHMEPR